MFAVASGERQFAVVRASCNAAQIDANGFFGSPEVKTDPSTGYLTRKVGWNEDYFVIASFDKASSALKEINVGALLGHAPAMPDDAATDEDTGDEDDSVQQ